MKIKGFSIKPYIVPSLGIILLLSLLVFLVISESKSNIQTVSTPTFTISNDSGIYYEPVDVEIIDISNENVIRYTLDSTNPTEQSTILQEPIKITGNTVVKFAFFKDGTQIGETITKVYIFDKHTFPTVVIVTEPDNLWSSEKGIYVVGDNAKAPNFNQKGDSWKKPADLFYFNENGVLDIQMPVEIRISGGATRYTPQKSLRVCAKKELGYSTINYDFFGSGFNKQHKCILLRNSGNDWDRTMFRDILGQSLIFETDVDTQAYKPSVLYLNGEYWGIHNIREFYDDQYLKYKYGAKKESVVIIEPDRKNGGFPVVRDGSSGDEDSYIELLNNMNDFRYLDNNIDIDNYIDYFLINVYAANADWPDNNIRLWRLKTENFQNMQTQPLDGKWRWLLFDLDSSFGLFKSNNYDFNTLGYATRKTIYVDKSKKEETWPTKIINTLLSNNDFQKKFLNRYADLLNTNFSEEKVVERIDQLEKQYEPEINMHTSKWGGVLDKGGKPAFETIEKWKENVQVLREFALNRPFHAREHAVSKFNLSGTYKIILKNLNVEGGYVKINSIDTKNNIRKNELIYFNDIPVTIIAKPNFGWKFSGWGTNDMPNKNTVTIVTNKDIRIDPKFELTWWGKIFQKL
jgi:hypothetical protein